LHIVSVLSVDLYLQQTRPSVQQVGLPL